MAARKMIVLWRFLSKPGSGRIISLPLRAYPGYQIFLWLSQYLGYVPQCPYSGAKPSVGSRADFMNLKKSSNCGGLVRYDLPSFV